MHVTVLFEAPNRPSTQGPHCDDSAELAAQPAGQSTHFEAPTSSWYVPGEQALHWSCRASGCTVPFAQIWHEMALASDHVPATHLLQLAMPDRCEKNPDWQPTQ
jgi:hypothetical protein